MIDVAYRNEELPYSGLHVAHNRDVFLKVWRSIALGMLRYDRIQPGDYLEVHVKLSRQLPVRPKVSSKDMSKDAALFKKSAKSKRKPGTAAR